ncbi:hypothetical protein QO001_004212 [Methylobacterium brachiatum]|uniref:Uncharacterized protein n=1 Tax=Methylobacterium brachiatum TaxID=269660 RepID=A0AAJ1TUZ6_9HYPH|nr:hypothetical protein [Methylobacterium brachiatum]MCB4804256.1 hypothetical protein [Methylobacterium brachiatum]MDQ0545269.1 hypothetical protein [Methylobacterium brachiatum]
MAALEAHHDDCQRRSVYGATFLLIGFDLSMSAVTLVRRGRSPEGCDPGSYGGCHRHRYRGGHRPYLADLPGCPGRQGDPAWIGEPLVTTVVSAFTGIVGAFFTDLATRPNNRADAHAVEAQTELTGISGFQILVRELQAAVFSLYR